MKRILSGNEAIARGAFEAGVKVGTGYPGTPSTEILENLLQYQGITVEWAPNEKVALEVGSGASLAGSRVLVTMKHVGVNVAADPLMTLPYIGVTGGLVLVTADDPDMHSSQNEQDNRNYAKFAKVPMLEPSDSEEAKDFTRIAFEISEKFDTVLLLRTTTRISHSESVVELGRLRKSRPPQGPKKDPAKYVMVPSNARKRHLVVEKRMGELRAFAEHFPENRIEWGKRNVGIITSGVCYHYSKEVFPEASYLKLGMVYPLPSELIKQFAKNVKELYVVEELDPFLEEHVRGLGIKVKGKALLPNFGEFNPDVVKQGITGKKAGMPAPKQTIPGRPPNLCPGCPHRGVFYALNRLKVFVTGDIGCYTLSCMPPLKALDTALCMGAGIGQAHGIDKAVGDKGLGKVAAVIGDSTFLHSGITGLLNMSYNKGRSTVIILDNRFTAMTGGQEHPGTGFTMGGEATWRVDYAQLSEALGIKHIRKVNPYHIEETLRTIQEEVNRPELSVVISESPCILNRREFTHFPQRYRVEESECIGCFRCINTGCPAIGWIEKAHGMTRSEKKKQKGVAMIDPLLCVGCSMCKQLCKAGAIQETKA
jgi:indolepyruvate ferredoxin oxidoreductase alpha subunit